MQVAIIADSFPPLRSSGAVQLRDLSREFFRQGHSVTVIVPNSDLNNPWLLENFDGVQVLRLRAPKFRDRNYVSRTINEFLMPFVMLLNFRKSPLMNICWGGVVWYSPSIFFGPFVRALKKASDCKSYLIVRDIFPEWAADTGIMRRGLPFLFFKKIANYQYSVADMIGIQTQGNYGYFSHLNNQKIQVLQNWLAEAPNIGCSLNIAHGKLQGRKIFVYAGNMGVSQGMDILISLAEKLVNRKDIGFLFVGRGSEVQRLRDISINRGIENVDFHGEIEPEEIQGLYKQCHVGIVALDPRHKSHNIPGKFLSYMQAGLPVLANINPGNDLGELIKLEAVGKVCSDQSLETLERHVLELLDELHNSTVANLYAERCKALSKKLFSPDIAVTQIVAVLNT